MDASTPDTRPPPTVVRVHYPFSAGEMTLRGSVAPADWHRDLPLARTGPDTWSLTLHGLTRPLAFKPMLAGQHWARGYDWVVPPGATLDVWPRFFRETGEWRRAWPDFHSRLLGNTRGVWLYLPPTYLENPLYRCPVVYLHDGQNLFDAQAAFGQNPWRVGETMDLAAQDGSIAEALVVGPENMGGERIAEYTPWVDPVDGGGRGARYLRMLVEELKPFVDATLRTRPGRAETALVGSSLGGLISAYAGVERPDVFGLIGAMSPSSSWARRALVAHVARSRPAPHRPLKVYVDAGDVNDELPDTEALVSAWRARGYADGHDLEFVVQPGAWHSETFWAQRLPRALQFLLGRGR